MSRRPKEPLVLGLDIGGSTTRALLVDGAGRRIGSGTAPGGNPTAHKLPAALSAIGAAVRGALGEAPPGSVAAAVIGMAGVGRLTEPEPRRRFDAMWRRLGLRCPYQAVGDDLVAFAAGTPSPDGTLLLAGTGAVATEIRDRARHRISDGHGWLLGDLGSGFWLGREAVRATLDHLDGWADRSLLARLVLRELLGAEPVPGRDAGTAVVNAVRRDPPVSLARLAPTVCRAARHGCPVARGIVDRAAGHLIASAGRVRSADDSPLVLAGGLLTADTPLAARVRTLARRRWPRARIAVARDGAAGAAWLAARSLPGLPVPPETLHQRLTAV